MGTFLRLPLTVNDARTMDFCGREECCCDFLTTTDVYNDELRCGSPHRHTLDWQIRASEFGECRYARVGGGFGIMTREGFLFKSKEA